ncbi:hypothetical protein [Hymenobacter siberiensis]|uniref:hypothetical protein n=1 Tax=Hymenobacter siberiensis TaxID=2848396 RepID=UPI001C1E3383|nr:hypothetical protein [Hymenobacter siberiensis]MBU6120325.1 hypothetical protein [Hymenobacter siberiensis]
MKHTILASLLTLGALAANAQTGTRIQVPARAITQLEDLKELTKAEVTKAGKATKAHAEVRPDLNRYLVSQPMISCALRRRSLPKRLTSSASMPSWARPTRRGNKPALPRIPV